MAEDETVGWNQQFNGHEFGQTQLKEMMRDGGRGLEYCSSWGCRESGTT